MQRDERIEERRQKHQLALGNRLVGHGHSELPTRCGDVARAEVVRPTRGTQPFRMMNPAGSSGHCGGMPMMWKVLIGLFLTLPAGAYAAGVIVGPPQPPAQPVPAVSAPGTQSPPDPKAPRTTQAPEPPASAEEAGSPDTGQPVRPPRSHRSAADNGDAARKSDGPSEEPEPTSTPTPSAVPTGDPSGDPSNTSPEPSPEMPTDPPTQTPSDDPSDGLTESPPHEDQR